MATYNLIYNSIYGNCPEVRENVSTITSEMLPTLTYENYTFEGWYYDQRGLQAVQVNDTLVADTIIYGKWASGSIYYAHMNSHKLLEIRGNTTADVSYQQVTIPSPTPDLITTLNTNGTIVRDYIKVNNNNVGEVDKLYRGNIILSADKFLDPPVLGLMGTNLYVIDDITNPTETIEFQADQVAIGTIYKINNHLTNVQQSADSYTFASPTSTVNIVYTPGPGYLLPTTIQVQNADYSWDAVSGTLTLDNPTAVVEVTITGVADI